MAVLGAGVVTPGAADLSPPGSSGVYEASPEHSATAAAPKVRTVVPARLKRGANARIPYVQDGWIHAGGKRFRTGLPEGRRQVLLGRSDGSWLVANGRKGVLRVHRVRPGRAAMQVPKSRMFGSLIGVRLSRDGEFWVNSRFDRSGSTYTVRRADDGTRVADYWASSAVYWTPYDAADGHVLMVGQADEGEPQPTYAADWEFGVGERRLGSGLLGGFLRRDVVFLEDAPDSGRYGPTAISAPSTPEWSARFAPLDLSPSGELVLGVGPSLVRQRQVLQVRRMSDGRVTRQFSFGRVIGKKESWAFDGQVAQTARFETNRKVVFEFASAGRAVLVRCTLTGGCARASRTGGALSTTYEGGRWAR